MENTAAMQEDLREPVVNHCDLFATRDERIHMKNDKGNCPISLERTFLNGTIGHPGVYWRMLIQNTISLLLIPSTSYCYDRDLHIAPPINAHFSCW
jgi:hypothetical protein